MAKEVKTGDIVDAEVTKICDFGAFVKFNGKNLGLIHISQISNAFVKDVNQYLKVGDRVKARVVKISPGKKIDLSLKKPVSQSRKNDSGLAHRLPARQMQSRKGQTGFKSSDFEEKLKKFLQDSQRNLGDLKRHNEKHYR